MSPWKKHKIKITYKTYEYFDNSPKEDEYTAIKMVRGTESLRKVALAVVRESAGKIKYNWLESVYNSQGIIFGLYDKAGEKKYLEIKYTINRDGSVKFLTDIEAAGQDFTLNDIFLLKKLKLARGNKKHIIIATPGGVGGAGGPGLDYYFNQVIPMITDLFEFAIFAYNGGKVIASLLTKFRNRKIRKIAKSWIQNNLKWPSDLRELLDYRGEWKLSEVKKILKLNEGQSIRLLTALGYEPVNNKWRLTQTKSSIHQRNKWMRNEKRWGKKAKQLLVSNNKLNI